MRRLMLVGLLSLLAAPASAASLTIENLWALPMTVFSLNANDWRILSADYGITAEPWLPIDITNATPLVGFSAQTYQLPEALAHGFVYGGLVIGGTCPLNCGWSTGPQDGWWPGDVVTDGSIIEAVWPAQDGGDMIPIARVTYHADPVETPEPAAGLLILLGGVVLSRWRRHQ